MEFHFYFDYELGINWMKTASRNLESRLFVCSKRVFRIFLRMYECVEKQRKWHFSEAEKENLPFVCICFSQQTRIYWFSLPRPHLNFPDSILIQQVVIFTIDYNLMCEATTVNQHLSSILTNISWWRRYT